MEKSRFSRRDFLRLSGLTLGATALASCVQAVPQQAQEATKPAGAAVGAAPPASETVEVTWLSHIYEPWNNALSALGMQYMGLKPNAKIVYSYVLHADLNTKIVTACAAGDAPTIMGVYGPWVPQLIRGKWVAEAPPDIVTDISDNFPAVMKDAAMYDGKLYAYVQHIGIPTPIINLDLYEADNVTPPTSYDELQAANTKLDKKDGNNWKQFGTTLATTKDGSWNVINMSAILFSFGGTWLSDDLTKAAFNTDAGAKAADVYKTLAHPEAPSDVFVLGKSAMICNGPWEKSAITASAPKLRYKALLPLKGPAAQKTGAYVWFWVVSAQAKPAQQSVAWDFCRWISAPEQYAGLYRNVGLLPITKKLPDEFAKDDWAQTFNQALNSAQIYYAKHPAWEKIDVAIGEQMERFVTGEIDTKTYLSTAEKNVNAILAG